MSVAVFRAISLGQTMLSLYRERRITVYFRVEGKDVESYLYVPICSLSFGEDLKANAIPEISIRKSVRDQPEYEKLLEDSKSQDDSKVAPATLKKLIDAYAAQAAISSERWLRDCLFAAGILEPTYSLLGYMGLSKTGQVTFAEHLEALSYLLVFDTNIFIKNVFSNYLRLRKSDTSKTLTSTVPAVIWELETKANNKSKPQESRLAKGAFRDVALMQSSTKYIRFQGQDSEAEPSDRLIRQQVRKFHFEEFVQTLPHMRVIDKKLFVTFDRTNALAAHAEGILCCSLDVPLEQSSWPLQPVGNQTRDELVGCLLMQLAILGGTTKITCNGMKDSFIMGDWAGKSSNDWISGFVRLEDFPFS